MLLLLGASSSLARTLAKATAFSLASVEVEVIFFFFQISSSKRKTLIPSKASTKAYTRHSCWPKTQFCDQKICKEPKTPARCCHFSTHQSQTKSIWLEIAPQFQQSHQQSNRAQHSKSRWKQTTAKSWSSLTKAVSRKNLRGKEKQVPLLTDDVET